MNKHRDAIKTEDNPNELVCCEITCVDEKDVNNLQNGNGVLLL